MIVTNALSHKITKSGQDPEGLGRWSVTTIQEKTKTRYRSSMHTDQEKSRKVKESPKFRHRNGIYWKNKEENQKMFAKQ